MLGCWGRLGECGDCAFWIRSGMGLSRLVIFISGFGFIIWYRCQCLVVDLWWQRQACQFAGCGDLGAGAAGARTRRGRLEKKGLHFSL